jgi:hypothetical protein
MPSRASTRTIVDELEDTNSLAARIVAQTTNTEPVREKNAAAVALGKLGASKGGFARAKSLTGAKRSAIARRAAEERWSREKPIK